MAAKSTSQMTAVQLAKIVATEKGWTGRTGGRIYDTAGVPIAHGWDALAALLVARGLVRVGAGINWQRFHTMPLRDVASL